MRGHTIFNSDQQGKSTARQNVDVHNWKNKLPQQEQAMLKQRSRNTIMSIIYDIHEWNLHICFFLAIMLNFILIWLIIQKSAKEMRFYSRILLQTAIVDILLVTITELLQITFFMYQSRVMIYLDGPLAKAFPYPVAQFILVSIWYQIYHMSIFGQAVQFFYRYLVLIRNIKISMARYWSLLLILVLITCIFLVLVAIAGYPIVDDERFVEGQQIAELIAGTSNNHTMLAVNMDKAQTIFTIGVNFYIMLNALFYTIIIFCAVKMIRFVRKNTVKSTQIELDRQLTRSLIALAIVPFLSMSCNVLVSFSFSLFDKICLSSDNMRLDLLVVSIQLLSEIPVTWITVFNPLIVVITIKSYRRTVVDFLIRARARVTPHNPQNGVIGQNSANTRPAWS